MTKKSLIFKAVLAMIFITCLITVFVPQTIYFAQREYFADYFINLAQTPIIFGLIIVISATIFLMILPQKLLKFIVSVLLVFSLLVWVYAAFFTVDYGLLDGSDINFDRYKHRGYIEIVVIFFAFAMAIIFHKFFIRQLPFAVLLILIGQSAITSVNIFTEPADKNVTSNMDIEFFQYSSNKNVILIILDAFGSEYFQKALTQDTSIAHKFKGFVSYTDALSNYPATTGSIPSFLTGRMIPEDTKYKDFLYEYVPEFGLPNRFSQKGYLVSVISTFNWFKHIYEERFVSEPKLSQKTMKKYFSAQLLDYSLFRIAPNLLKSKVFNNGDWLVSREISNKTKIPNSNPEKGNFFLELMTKKMIVKNQTPRFKMIHALTPHPEFKFNRNCEFENFDNIDKAMLEQSMCALKKLSELLEKYKEKGIYDKSLIVITSDHGSRIIKDRSLTGFPSYFEMKSSGILFMVKGIGQNDNFIQVNQPFSLVKLYNALLDESLHTSKYDFLEDNQRLFYAYRNHHKKYGGYIQDAPLFEVGSNYRDTKSWHLLKFITHACTPNNIPLRLTFNSNGREGYCSIFGFLRPHPDKNGSWTESVDSKVILKFVKSKIQTDKFYNLELYFSPNIADQQKSIDLIVSINDTEIGRKIIKKKGYQTINFSFKGDLIKSNDQTVISLKMPNLKTGKEMNLNNNTRKLGLLLEEIKIY